VLKGFGLMKSWVDFVDSIASKFAFYPPQPSTYNVLEHIDGQREFYIQPIIRRVVIACVSDGLYNKQVHH
jgi:hypothetical protein